jgi:hypothetical protein
LIIAITNATGLPERRARARTAVIELAIRAPFAFLVGVALGAQDLRPIKSALTRFRFSLGQRRTPECLDLRGASFDLVAVVLRAPRIDGGLHPRQLVFERRRKARHTILTGQEGAKDIAQTRF